MSGATRDGKRLEPPYARPMRRTAAAAIVLAVLSGACVADRTEAAPSASTSATEVRHVVFDTDLAFDDIMALLYLLQRDDVAIDAVTITGTGEAHCDPGVQNALRLLALGGNHDTPVACGRETPLQGSNAFPDEWRVAVDDLSMLDLPQVDRVADPRGATAAADRHARRRRHADHARSAHERRRRAPSGPRTGVARACGRLDGRGDRRGRQHAQRCRRIQRVGRPRWRPRR